MKNAKISCVVRKTADISRACWEAALNRLRLFQFSEKVNLLHLPIPGRKLLVKKISIDIL